MRGLIIIFFSFFSCLSWAELPSGNSTITGDISISSDTQTMTIDQQSDQAIIEWNSFNIGENNNVEVTSNDQTEIVENMIGDINKIVPFVSVDAIVGSTMSLQLARESNIQSAPNAEGLGIQSL